METKYSKYCLVPHCQSSTIRTPGKIFISLPVGSSAKLKKKRTLWLKAMRRKKEDISENTRGFVCEDHFNLEDDMENYLRYKMMGGNIILKDHVVPHIFSCQTDTIKRSLETSERTVAVKRPKKNLVDTLISQTSDEQTFVENDVQSTQIEVVPIVEPAAVESTSAGSEDTEVNKPQPPICKNTQTDNNSVLTCSQRTVAVQVRPYYRSKFVQTDQVMLL